MMLLLEIYLAGDFIFYNKDFSVQMGRIRAIVKLNNNLMIKIQKIIKFDELPTIFKTINHQNRADLGEVWLVEDQEDIILVDLESVIRKISLTTRGGTESADYYIKEILYKNNKRLHLRDITLEHRHPADTI